MIFGRSSTRTRPVAWVLVVALLALGLFSVIPGASAQQAPPTISLLNPEDGTSNEISFKPNGGDEDGYHLNAFANLTGMTNPVVEFKLRQAGVEVGSWTASRSGDTFEHFLTAAEVVGLSDGAYEVQAVLYEVDPNNNTGVEKDSDSEAAELNNSTPTLPANPQDDANQSSTVEITYPDNTGGLGYYQTPNSNTSHFVIQGSVSDGTSSVQGFYSTTPPGQEVSWTSCGAAQTVSGSGTRNVKVRCSMSGDPTTVTAVALVPKDSPSGAGVEDADAADAHRVFPYKQEPTTVTVSPETQRVAAGSDGTYPCQYATATIKDQNDRPIAGANVDVHAQGPDDQLYFDTNSSTGNNRVDANKAPDAGGHSLEAARDCNAGTYQANRQGEVNLIGPGTADIKHIESANGSNNDGQFRFGLWHRGGPGVTQITVWADEDDDDEHCGEEASGNAAMGWGTEANPAVTGVSPMLNEPTCSTDGRSVTLTASDSKIKAYKPVTFSGNVFSENQSCRDAETVEIYRRPAGANEYEASPWKVVTTDEGGSYSVTARPGKSFAYQARVSETAECDDAVSNEVTVDVAPRVTRTVSDKTPERGSMVTISVKVRPQHDGTEVVLQEETAEGWVNRETAVLDDDSRAKFTIKAAWKGSKTFRVEWPQPEGHTDHVTGYSRPVTITTH